MTLRGWQGVDAVLPKIGYPNAAALTVVYGAALITGGLRRITSISGAPLPANLFVVPTGKSQNFSPQKTQERIKIYGGPEEGILNESSGGTTAAISLLLSRAAADSGRYEEAADLLIAAAGVLNEQRFVSFERFMATVAGFHRYHYRAGVFNVTTNAQTTADENQVMQEFTLSSSGTVIDGYYEYPV
jgi:hypothetical protein